MVRVRILFGLLMIAALAGLFWGDTYLESHHEVTWAPLFFVVVGLLAIGGTCELNGMLNRSGRRVRWWLTVPATSGIIITAASAAAGWGEACCRTAGPAVIGPALLIMVALLLTVLLLEVLRTARTGDFDTPLISICATLLGPMYIGVLLLAVVAIRFLESPGGLAALIVFLAVCKLSDVGAYFTGRFLGRHKMTPRLSPGKTWEGLAGGFLLSLAASLGLGMPLAGFSALQAIVFGLVVAGASVMGDLAESLLKRSCGQKDSGQMVPEFGGVLDIVDSILVSAPFAYGLLLLFGGSHQL